MPRCSRLPKRIAELKPCRECAEHGGLWVPGATGGVRRCGCVRGRLLDKSDALKIRKSAVESDYDAA